MTSFHHQPEAQHPKSSAIHKLGRPITPSVGSIATELVKVDAGTCPLRSESDRNNAVPRMNAIAKSGPTTPASGCISCLSTKRQISTTRGGLDRRLARGQSGAAACAFTSPRLHPNSGLPEFGHLTSGRSRIYPTSAERSVRRSEVEADRVRGHHHDSGRIKIAPHPARISRRSMLATLSP